MATAFEEAMRAAIQASGLTYTQLSKEANVDATAIGRFMTIGTRFLTVKR